MQRSAKRKRNFVESKHQQALISWFDLQHPTLSRLLIHVSNEGKRSKAEGGILKAMGLRKGVPDLFLMAPRGTFHGLIIEIKAPGKKPSDEQQEYIKLFNDQDYCTCWVDDWTEAKTIIENYLRLPEWKKT